MISWRQIKMLVPIIALGSLVLITALASPLAAASPPLAPPTPTNTAQGSGGKDNFNPPAPEKAMISGRVYNYSSARGQSGITVILEGAEGSWKLETTTDTNGYYGFGELGEGKALLSLQLPSDATPVTADWPLDIRSGDSIALNLGYYWDGPAPIPVLLSTQLQGNLLLVRVGNRTTEPATGGAVEIVIPDHLKASSGVISAQASLDSHRKNRIVLKLDSIPAGENATIKVPLTTQVLAAANPERPPHPTALYQQTIDNVQVFFNYDQQLTPQHLVLGPKTAAMTGAPAEASTAAGSSKTPAAASGSTRTNDTTQATPTAPEVDDSPVSAQDVDAGSDSDAQATEHLVLPISGTGPLINGLAIVLPVLLVLGLGTAGWRALKQRN